MKQDKFYGQVKKETEKAIMVGTTWIPKSAIAEKIKVVKEDGYAPKRDKFYIRTSFPLNVSGWAAGYIELELEDGQTVRVK